MAIVLLVDDDPDVRDTIALILTCAGHVVREARNGLAALDLIDENGPFDLLLTDVMMPGLNGFNLALMAKLRRPSLKILYLTGYYEKLTALQSQGQQFGKVLTKPILPDDLRNEIEQTLAACPR